MRRLVAVSCIALLTACGSTPPTNGTPPAGAPATIILVSGDGQTAAPATALPVKLAVLVKDESGVGVPGVVAHFAVDSGGGSLSLATVTTGSDGTATGVTWTLGSEGTNVVEVTVAALAPVRFHAHAFGSTSRTLIDHAAIGPGGGTLTYGAAGDALAGLAITVPAAAYSTSTSWTVVADSTVAIPLPAEFSQVGPALVISNGQGFADSAMSLVMPMNAPAGDAVAPFYFDPVTGTLEPIPLVARTATSATLATHHFSRDLMAIPGAAPAGLHGSLRGFGDVVVVWVRLPAASLAGTFTTGFQPQHDNWEFVNYGDYIAPRGICEGMSITEMYYYYFINAGGASSLYHHFDRTLKTSWDNVQGIRFAGSVQGDSRDYFEQVQQIKVLNVVGAIHDISPMSLTASWVVLTMKLTHQPVLIAVFGSAGAHAVVAFKVTTVGTTTTVFFADPNYPELSRGMTFQGTQLQPLDFQLNADEAAGTFTAAYAFGVSAEIPIRSVDARWTEFLNQQAGQDRYPAHRIEVYDSLNQVWDSLGDTVRTALDEVRFRVRCAACPAQVREPALDPPDLQNLSVFSDSGATSAAPSQSDLHTVLLFSLPPGPGSYFLLASAPSSYVAPPTIAFLDSRFVTVIYSPVKIIPDQLAGRADTAYTFTATNAGLGARDTKFTWSFGDQTPAVTASGDSTVQHTFADTGQFVIRVEMRDASGKLLARATTTTTISNTVAHSWRITSAFASSSSLPAGGIGGTKADTEAVDAINGWIAKIQQDPAGSTLLAAVLLDQDCGVVYMNQAGSSAIGPGRSDLETGVGLFAESCVDPDHHYFGSFALGPIGTGTLTGEADLTTAFIHAVGAPSGSINAVMHGSSISGTINWQIALSNGTAVFTVQFTGVLIVPPGAPGLRAPVRRAP